jgi:translocation and assembly module TamA
MPEKAEARDFHVPVLVQLKPAPSRSLRQGIGYGTDTGGRFNVRYRDLNMLQRGHEFYSNLYISERLQGIAAGYILPDAVDIRSSTVLQLNLQQEDVTTYKSRLIALELDKNHSFGKRELGTAYIRLQREEYTIGAQDSSARLVLPGLRLSGDHYDNPIRPTRGFRYAFDLRGTHQLFGSDTELLQLISEGSWLLSLPWRLSLQTRAKAGITLLSDPLSDLPPSLRFFAGGDQSVRGYSYQSLGPSDAAGQVVGGKHLFTGSVEIERALFSDWGVSVFYDAGNAFDSFTGVRLFEGTGVGVHYYTPVGALNLSVARQIGVDDPGFRIHFTVGLEF